LFRFFLRDALHSLNKSLSVVRIVDSTSHSHALLIYTIF
jgi:hypothetical protein